ncbi:PREDICTED: uncharacterized protein LOC106784435 isoform X1 [Polistes canadensis]|uniref:uncharacterized protein LOC106784435 isoform X1 n=2 Tax=Polistes canadensis TaxID=91411 RepID=UPI000718F674|nr:PREDICTED: uncharacterized protein LOC106784435 isoform X1 [Polistes canadensis]
MLLTDHRLFSITCLEFSKMAEDIRVRVACFLIIVSIVLSDGQLMTKEHRTNAASERPNNLWCYQCDSMEDGDLCSDLPYNHSSFIHKCKDDKRICMVKRFSYTTSTENSTSSPHVWSLERNCTSKCEPGCIVIGERTKLYACTACCDKSLCNTGTGTANDLTMKEINFLLALILQIVLTITMYSS